MTPACSIWFAVAAALPLTAVAEPAACERLLAELADISTGYGYAITKTAGEVFGLNADESELRARCEVDRAEIEMVGPDGSIVHIEVTARTMNLDGEFPGVGRVSQSWVGDDLATGVVSFAADAGTTAAAAAYDFASGAWTVSGDPDGVNARLEPSLGVSSAWKDAHALLYNFTGVLRSGLEGDEGGLDAMLPLAIPLPGAYQDVDKGDVKKDCGATIGICAVAYFWKPATGACIAAGVKCFSAFKCWRDDCSGDGKE